MSREMKLFSLAVLLMLAATAAADFGCQNSWSGASKNNDVTGCLTTSLKTYTNYIAAAVCIVFLVVVLIVFPVCFFCWCCCGCCSCCRNFWDRAHDDVLTTRNRLLCLSFTLSAAAVAVAIVIIVGSVKGFNGVGNLFTDFDEQVIQYFQNLITKLRSTLLVDGTSVITSGDSYLDPVQDTIYTLRNGSDTVSGKIKGLNNTFTYVAACIGCIPLLLVLLTLLFRLCSCRRCCPNLFACVAYFFAIIFFIVAFIFLLITPIWRNFCDEIDLQDAASPGLFQWYVVPYCSSLGQFDSLTTSFNSYEKQYAEGLCGTMSETCDTTTTFSSAPDYFYCPLVSINSSCQNYTFAAYVLNSTFAKTGSTACVGNCTWRDCVTQCTNTTMASVANETVYSLKKAGACVDAISLVTPILSCDFLVNLTLKTFSSCRDIQQGIYESGLCLLFGGIIMFITIFIFLNGAHTWANSDDLQELHTKNPDGLSMKDPRPRTSQGHEMGEV